MTKLEPGFYRLTRDVKNPHPDRRQKHDFWLMDFEEGRAFEVYQQEKRGKYDPGGLFLKPIGRPYGSAVCLNLNYAKWNRELGERIGVLLPHLEEIQGFDAVRLKCKAEGVLPWEIIETLYNNPRCVTALAEAIDAVRHDLEERDD